MEVKKHRACDHSIFTKFAHDLAEDGTRFEHGNVL